MSDLEKFVWMYHNALSLVGGAGFLTVFVAGVLGVTIWQAVRGERRGRVR